jgi:hypothetical protein
MTPRDQLVALLRTIGLREIDSPSVFDLKPGEFLRCDDGSLLFGNGRGYGGAFFALDFDEAGAFTGTEFLGVLIDDSLRQEEQDRTSDGPGARDTNPREGDVP